MQLLHPGPRENYDEMGTEAWGTLPRHGRSRCADGITSLCRGHLALAFHGRHLDYFRVARDSGPTRGAPLKSTAKEITSATGAGLWGLAPAACGSLCRREAGEFCY